ncbi:MAG: DNA-3-methyladenine glycosylase I [Planctomycetota bacterium]
MPNTQDLIQNEEGVTRCWWCGNDPVYQAYHDDEWGVPVTDDQRLFEKLCLEAFQCGLSWITILKRRDAFRRAFHDFQIERVAKMNEEDTERLLQDDSIIRHRGKIEATLHNARMALKTQSEFGSMAAFLWQFEPANPPTIATKADMMSKSPESTEMSRALKSRGWKFVGPTTCYSLMQAMGMVNDHLVGCSRFEAICELRQTLRRHSFVR